MTIPSPTAIKRSSTPAPQAPAAKGSSSAQKVDAVLSRRPEAKHVFISEALGVKELSTSEPNWFQRKYQGGSGAINNGTQAFFYRLGVKSLFHLDPGVRDAAAFLAAASQKPDGDGKPFDLTPKIRAAVRTLANPGSGAFAQYLQREEKEQFLRDTGFGKNLPQQAEDKLKSEFVQTPWGDYTRAALLEKADRGIAFVNSRTSKPVTKEEDPLVELDAPAPLFQAVEDAEWRSRRDEWRKGTAHTTPEVNAAVTAYARRTYGEENPFEKPSSAGQSVSDLLTYITKPDVEEKLVDGGRSTQRLNRFNNLTFESRTEALYHLLWNTNFLNEVPPAEANRFMKMYNELAGAGL